MPVNNVKRSFFDVYCLTVTSLVIVGNVIATLLIATQGCKVLIGVWLWFGVAALFAALVLLPSLIRWLFVAPLIPVVKRFLVAAVIATAVPAVLASIPNDRNLGHCIA